MKPLEDVRIVSLEQYGAGPFGSLHLADLGAEVIKIEDPRVGRGHRALRAAVRRGRGLAVLRDVQPQQAELVARHHQPRPAAGCSRTWSAHSDVVYSNLRGDVPGQDADHLRRPQAPQSGDRLLLALRIRYDRAPIGRARL